MAAPRDADDEIVNSEEFVIPWWLQIVSARIALCNTVILLWLGGTFLILPQTVLSVLLGYRKGNDPSSDNIVTTSVFREGERQQTMQLATGTWDNGGEDPIDSVTRMAGGVLLAQGLSCLLLLYPLLVEEQSSQQRRSRIAAVWNVRTTIAMQSVTGLMWIVVGLLDDRANEANKGEMVTRRETFGLLMVGFLILMLACLSLMVSFWPVEVVLVTPGTTDDVHSRTTNIEASSTSRGDLLEPLLTAEASPTNQLTVNDGDDTQLHGNGTETTGSVDEEAAEHYDLLDDEFDGTTFVDESPPAPEVTSRIRGTRRLLHLAAPQVIYLYVGCITLLIRLPFSLCIPHFVSTTLGAMSDGEFDRGRREILWLFILGTIDAWYVFGTTAGATAFFE